MSDGGGVSRLGLSISALFVLALLLYLPVWMEEEPETREQQRIDALQPAYKARNLTTTFYDDEGNRNHQIFATSMEHYDELGFVLFQQPEYTIYLEQQTSSWQVTAKEGTLYNDDLIQLDSDVLIKSLNDDAFVSTISTEFIEVNLDTQKMVSDQPVLIRGTPYTINSNGFKADLKTQEYELIDHVQTIYSPGN
ncbi:LPS export ABC transporter periplasmic protein LptC [Alteromonas antoniana]|uniref:LPS export ABC transporter periplasmic protein LptC n=1 Tax=Alteromonas antoniana TaxID=2803813 RepID=UPI001C468147|nr:LPS export ABC transporter periplasmic protein LptC [Alteromonas antoniana]